MTHTATAEASRVAIVRSHWSTQDLVGFACYWNRYYGSKPLWHYIVGHNGSSRVAVDFYASLTDDQERREYAAEALVAGGWTIDSINYRKS